MVDANGLIVVVGKDAYLIDAPWLAEVTEEIVHWISAVVMPGHGTPGDGSLLRHTRDLAAAASHTQHAH